MHAYTLAQLALPDTYSADAELATLARRVATSRTDLDLSTGDRKRLALSGGMAQAVFEALAAANAAQATAAESSASTDAAGRAALAGITLPDGWALTIGATDAELSGPIDETMNTSLRRHGHWDATARVWRVQISKGQTLARSLKRAAGPAAAAARQVREDKLRRQEIERWIGFIESSAREGRIYDRGVNECRARSVQDFADLKQRLDAAITLATDRAAAVSRARTTENAARQARYAAERAQRAEQLSRRRLFPIAAAPVIGRAYRLAGSVVVYTSAGTKFRLSDDHPSTHGSHLLGHEGEMGMYCYYRDATASEIAELEACEARACAAEQQQVHRDTEIRDLVATISQPDNLAPMGSESPVAELVVHDRRNSGGHAMLIDRSGAVWCIQPNGLDSDDWSRNNLPGAMAWRSTDPTLIARARVLLLHR